MTMAAASVPLPNSIERTELRVVCGASFAAREVLVSCTLDTGEHQNLDILRWPKYHKNGLPSKFLKPSDAGKVQRLTDLYLPGVEDRTLQVAVSSESVDDWSNWAVLLLAREGKSSFPLLWTLYFGRPK